MAPGQRADLAAHYAELETLVGADFATVKRNFRRLMRAHHPDLHARTPATLSANTERAKRLTVAYAAIERALLGQQR